MPRKRVQPPVASQPEPSKEAPKTVWVQFDEPIDDSPRELPSDTPVKYSPQENRKGLSPEMLGRLFFLREVDVYSNILVHFENKWVPALVINPPPVLRVEINVAIRHDEQAALEEIARLLHKGLEYHQFRHRYQGNTVTSDTGPA